LGNPKGADKKKRGSRVRSLQGITGKENEEDGKRNSVLKGRLIIRVSERHFMLTEFRGMGRQELSRKECWKLRRKGGGKVKLTKFIVIVQGLCPIKKENKVKKETD